MISIGPEIFLLPKDETVRIGFLGNASKKFKDVGSQFRVGFEHIFRHVGEAGDPGHLDGKAGDGHAQARDQWPVGGAVFEGGPDAVRGMFYKMP